MEKEASARKKRYATAIFNLTILLTMVSWMLLGQPVYGQGLPSATVRVWNISTPIGVNPDPSIEDVDGLTKHVATPTNPRTIVTAIENTIHPGGPCGVIFWNPVTSLFKWFGIGFGFQVGVDVNVKAPLKTDGGGKTFGPGDVWLAKTGCPGLYMNFAGSSNFRSFGITTKGVQVDQTTGNVWSTEILSGNVLQLDPATSGATRWNVGGSPHFVALDSAGRAYATVGCLDQVVRIDPASNEVRRWAIPGGGLRCGLFFETSDGITIDSAGKIWFAESASSEIGRLDPSSNEICEFTKSGLSNPQLVASSGSGDILQVFFTEGAGDAASVLTQKEAAGTCATVTPAVQTLVPSVATLAFTDFTEEDGQAGCPCVPCRSPLTATITPTTHVIPGVDGGGASGTIKTIDGLPVPGILRFPFPSASPPVSVTFPSGMTRVVFPNTIYGSDLFNNHVFEVKTSAIIAPPPPSVQKCPLTQGFWKSHPKAWPVSSLVLGSQTYTQVELLTILGTPPTGDASLILAKQLIAAKLNIFNSSDPTPIFATINAADSLLGGFTGKLPYKVEPSSTTGQAMVNDGDILDGYNNGQLTPNCLP